MGYISGSRRAVKSLGVRNRPFVQVDHVGMSLVILTFVPQSGREAARILSTRIDYDN